MVEAAGRAHSFLINIKQHRKSCSSTNYNGYPKGAFTYDVSSRGGRGIKMLTVATKEGEGV